MLTNRYCKLRLIILFYTTLTYDRRSLTAYLVTVTQSVLALFSRQSTRNTEKLRKEYYMFILFSTDTQGRKRAENIYLLAPAWVSLT